jgi:hypothetical protein
MHRYICELINLQVSVNIDGITYIDVFTRVLNDIFKISEFCV